MGEGKGLVTRHRGFLRMLLQFHDIEYGMKTLRVSKYHSLIISSVPNFSLHCHKCSSRSMGRLITKNLALRSAMNVDNIQICSPEGKTPHSLLINIL